MDTKKDFDSVLEELLEKNLPDDVRMLIRELQNEHGNIIAAYKKRMISLLDEATGYDETALIPYADIQEIIEKAEIGE